MTADRRKTTRKPKSLYERVDEILEEPGTNRWSTTRVVLLGTIFVFLFLSSLYAEFRDSGAFVTVILALIGAAVAPKILDLRMAIGKAAETIGSKFRKKEETVTTETETVRNGPEPEPPARSE